MPPLPTAMLNHTTTEDRPSFAKDMEGFVKDVTNAFSAHPELSEGWRNLVRNSSDGRYWQNERVKIVDTARNAVQSINAVVDEQAVEKVTEIIGGIFNALGETLRSLGSQASTTPDLTPHPPAE